MASSPSVGTTLTSGIQDIASLLPLLGTEQCEHHVGSALTNGYLYAAATPMSIFGSLGMARAGLKGLIASISSHQWRFIGSQKLEDAGFTASGTNLSLIMMDPNHRRRHLAESKLDCFLETLHIDDVEKLTVVTRCFQWNLTMLLLTTMSCILGLTPYIHLNLGHSALPRSTRLVFPITRVVGGFLTASSLQFLLQLRLVAILKHRLAFRALNALIKANDISLPDGVLWDREISSELCLWDLERHSNSAQKYPWRERLRRLLAFIPSIGVGRDEKLSVTLVDNSISPSEPTQSREDMESGPTYRHQQPADPQIKRLAEIKVHFSVGTETIWPFIILAVLGIAASVAGYIGCFSVVQGSTRPTGPLIWLAVEGGLSVIRMVLWGWNPGYDDLDPLTFSLKLNKYPPLPTCNKSQEGIDHDQSLPLMRATEFLESVTAYAGLVERFDHPNLSLFYTLTCEAPRIQKRILYITIFDHSVRSARIYHENDNDATFMSAGDLELDAPNNILRTTIKNNLEPNQDPVIGHWNLRSDLQQHYRSIMSHLRSRDNEPWKDVNNIQNQWTLDPADISHKGSKGKNITAIPDQQSPQNSNTGGGKITEGSLSPVSDIINYLTQGNYQRTSLGRLYEKRGHWIEHYMEYVRAESEDVKRDDGLLEAEVERQTELREWMFLYERMKMESILLEELQKWEVILWKEHEEMMKGFKKTRKSDSGWKHLKKRLQNEWNFNAELRLKWEQDVTDARSAEEMKRLDSILGSGWEQMLKKVWESALKELQSARQTLLEGQTLHGRARFAWNFRRSDVREEDPLRLGLKESIKNIRGMQGDTKGCMGRLKWETADMNNRVKPELLPDCDDLWTSKSIAKLVLGRSKWTKVDSLDTYYDDLQHFKTIIWALQTSMRRRNNMIFFIQFTKPHLLKLAEAMPLLHETPITTVVFVSGRQNRIEEQIRAPLLEAITKNRAITSISGLDLKFLPEIKQQLVLNQERIDPKIPSITAHDFLIGEEDDDLHGGLESRLDWRFMGPSTGPLSLRLRHRYKIPPRLEINDAANITCPAVDSESDSFQLQTVQLKPFRPDSPNVLSVISADDEYVLRDIDLLDGKGEPYIYVEPSVNPT